VPIIEVKMFAGRTGAQKAELARRMTDDAVDVLGVDPGSVRVLIHDTPKENWAVAGVLIAESERA
jgi:4-oxalocrotonate tautomerase